MMRFFFMFIMMMLIQGHSFAQINPEWRKLDMEIIDSVRMLDQGQPGIVETFFQKHRYRYLKADSLGFGWTKTTCGIGGGYISIRADLLYLHDTIQTYILYSYLPHEDALKAEYRSLFLTFLPDYNGNSYSFTYNKQAIYKPLDDFASYNRPPDTASQILEYMSPNSGIIYGYTGGIASSTLENRRNFNGIKEKLNPDQIVQIMYSVNPASRLTAIEYYLRNKRKFKNRPFIDQWIERVYKELPKVETMSGCIESRESAKMLVYEFVRSRKN